MKYAVIYEQGPESWGAYVPDLPGCIAVGDTLEETQRLLQEAVQAHLEALREEGLPVPAPTSQAGEIEVKAPAA